MVIQIHSVIQSLKTYNTQNNSQPQDLKYLSHPYIWGVSDNIKRDLRKRRVRVPDKPNNDSQWVFSKLNTETDTNNKTNVGYRVKWEDSEGAYIG